MEAFVRILMLPVLLVVALLGLLVYFLALAIEFLRSTPRKSIEVPLERVEVYINTTHALGGER